MGRNAEVIAGSSTSAEAAVGVPAATAHDDTAATPMIGGPKRAGSAVEVATVWLPVGLDAVRVARAHLVEVLTAWDVDEECVSDAVLLVSELVSNVVTHTQVRSVGVDVGATDRRIVVGVRESGVSGLPLPTTHVLADFSPTAMPAAGELHGRGLKILDALAAEWGISRAHRSTSTWFTLAPLTPPPLHVISPAAAAQLESVQASLRRTQLLLRITEQLGTAVTAEQVGDVITRHLRDHLQAMFTGVALLTPDRLPDPDGRGLRVMRYLDLSAFPDATRAEFARFTVDVDVPVAAAALTRTPFFHRDRVVAEQQFPGLAAHMATAGAGALAHLPLLAGGSCLGTLAVAWAAPRDIDADTVALLTIVTGYAAQALHRHTTRGTDGTASPTVMTHADEKSIGVAGAPSGETSAALARAEQRLADAQTEFDAALDFGESLPGLVAIEAEIKRATAALAVVRASRAI